MKSYRSELTENNEYRGSTQFELDDLLGNVLTPVRLKNDNDFEGAKKKMIARLVDAKKLPVYNGLDPSKLDHIINLVNAADWSDSVALMTLLNDIRRIAPK
ncbi:hypothetical protein KA111_01780 [Candidatus Woesebacteria bacterium]|nr:hypothetical protein [Candidatus Woesebacteria bacterium]